MFIFSSYQKTFRPDILFLGFIFFILIIVYCTDVYEQWKLKSEAKKYLEKLKYEFENDKCFRLILTENSFTVISDKNKIIENWANINEVEIMDDFTILNELTPILRTT